MITHTLKQIQEMTSKEFGLQISASKTELVYHAGDENAGRALGPAVSIDGIPLKTESKFKYLCSYVTDDSKIDQEISPRIQTASAACGKPKRKLWNGHEITLKLS